jgi:hypothetical protein
MAHLTPALVLGKGQATSQVVAQDLYNKLRPVLLGGTTFGFGRTRKAALSVGLTTTVLGGTRGAALSVVMTTSNLGCTRRFGAALVVNLQTTVLGGTCAAALSVALSRDVGHGCAKYSCLGGTRGNQSIALETKLRWRYAGLGAGMGTGLGTGLSGALGGGAKSVRRRWRYAGLGAGMGTGLGTGLSGALGGGAKSVRRPQGCHRTDGCTGGPGGTALGFGYQPGCEGHPGSSACFGAGGRLPK